MWRFVGKPRCEVFPAQTLPSLTSQQESSWVPDPVPAGRAGLGTYPATHRMAAEGLTGSRTHVVLLYKAVVGSILGRQSCGYAPTEGWASMPVPEQPGLGD